MFKRFLRDIKGVATIELVFLLPIFLIIVISGFEVGRYVMIISKLQTSAYALSNVVAQTWPATVLNSCDNSRLSEGTLGNISSGISSMMAPFSDGESNVKVIVSSLQKDGAGFKLRWRKETGTLATDATSEVQAGAPGSDAVFVDPANQLKNKFAPLKQGENLLVLEAFYRYVPIFPKIFGEVSDTFTEHTIPKRVYFYNRLGKAIYLPPGVPVVGEIACGAAGPTP